MAVLALLMILVVITLSFVLVVMIVAFVVVDSMAGLTNARLLLFLWQYLSSPTKADVELGCHDHAYNQDMKRIVKSLRPNVVTLDMK
jgi:hypothetical protein